MHVHKSKKNKDTKTLFDYHNYAIYYIIYNYITTPILPLISKIFENPNIFLLKPTRKKHHRKKAQVRNEYFNFISSYKLVITTEECYYH